MSISNWPGLLPAKGCGVGVANRAYGWCTRNWIVVASDARLQEAARRLDAAGTIPGTIARSAALASE
jgi:hypothetical protein